MSDLIGNYYGLDWATLVLGVTASLLLTGGRLRLGFSISILACICAFAVATMSHQNGFVVYNLLLIAINMRGILRGERRRKAAEPAAAPARA